MYLNLLFKSIKADVGVGGEDRIKALVRRFVQVLVSGGSGAPEFIAGGLFLLGEVGLTHSLPEKLLLLTMLLALQHDTRSSRNDNQTITI